MPAAFLTAFLSVVGIRISTLESASFASLARCRLFRMRACSRGDNMDFFGLPGFRNIFLSFFSCIIVTCHDN